jgi:hypothetical protein
MSDSAHLVCLDCQTAIEVGYFWNVPDEGPRILFDDEGRPSWSSADLTRAVWRMFAEHVYHDLRLLGERSAEWDRIDPRRRRTIGGELTSDPTVAEYLADWPG